MTAKILIIERSRRNSVWFGGAGPFNRACAEPVEVLRAGSERSQSAHYKPCSQALHKQPYDVITARSISAALNGDTAHSADLVILDAASMHTSGVRMCQALRRCLPGTPLLLICPPQNSPAPDGIADAVLSPPFTARKLLNRIRRLLPITTGKWIVAGPIRLSPTHRRAICGDREASLTQMQARLLETFLRHPNKLLARKFLMKAVWRTDYDGDTRTLDVHNLP